MELSQHRFLIIDCQTTGMRPSVGHLLEIAWAWASADMEPESVSVKTFLVSLPPRAWLPPRVQEITGIKDSDLEESVEVEQVRSAFLETLREAEGQPVTALIHYSQFEEPFLAEFLKDQFPQEQVPGKLPFDCLCTHKLAKKLYPSVPSRNIRGLTGFFGSRIGEIKRAAQHVKATHLIWKGLSAALKEAGVTDLASTRAYLAEVAPKAKKGAPKLKTPSYEYRVDRAKRLSLPDRPGIYKMKDKDGHILYVGKATSLKDRVNSYFRGKKGRDPRKLEMMAQVWDLETVECGSAIEAALIESDEIKRLDPPYNVSLKGQRRSMMFYSKDFETNSVVQTVDHPIGPFRRFNSIDHLRTLVWGLKLGNVINVFHQEIDPDVLRSGYDLFVAKHSECGLSSEKIRDHLAIGLWLTKKLTLEMLNETVQAEDAEGAEGEEAGDELSDAGVELSPEDVAGKFERLYMRSAASYLRARLMTKLLWSDVSWTEKGEEKKLSIRHGQIGSERVETELGHENSPWRGLQISDYDRMSILIAEIGRFPHRVTKLARALT